MQLSVKVITRAKKTEIVGRMADGTLKIRLKAVPEHGQANDELVRYLAEVLELRRDRVEIVSGFTDERKIIKLPDLTLPW